MSVQRGQLTKQELREKIWNDLEESGDTLFPGAYGRIPNFKGREKSAERLTDSSDYREASAIKINPDSPQTPIRRESLSDGKTLYMAAPKLRDKKCFLELDPAGMDGEPSDWCTIKGASRYGSPVHPREMPEVDLIVTGAVGVDPEGHRLGKGGGYSDLEFAILLECDRIDRSVPILSSVHPIQEVESGKIPGEDQDITLDGYFLPDRTVRVDDPPPRPSGLLEEDLDDDKLESIPVLEDLPVG